MDRDPSNAIHLVQLDANRRSSSLDLPPAPAGQRQEVMIKLSATATSRQANCLREWVRNGGRSFLRTLGSFPSYSRRTLRTIHTRWRNFRETHPAATRYAKWASWLSGIAVSIGSAVSLPIELYRTFHGLNQTVTALMSRIKNVTAQLDRLQNQSLQEFDLYPDQTIFDWYHAPLRRTERGSYRLEIEDVPRSEDNPTKMDPLFQDILGFPEEIEDALKQETTTAASALRQQLKELDINRVSHLVKGFTSMNVTLNATGSPAEIHPASHLEKGLTWYGSWGIERLSPRTIGWIMLAMVGFITLPVYAVTVLCIRRCCILICSQVSRREEDSQRALPPEPELSNLELDNLSTINNVNLYEVVPLSSIQLVPVSN